MSSKEQLYSNQLNQINYPHLSFDEYQEFLNRNLSYNEHLALLNNARENKQNTKDMRYKIFNVKEILDKIQYAGVRKGTQTEAYLENIIESINATGKYKWVQFFQLVDVFYVVVQVMPTTVKTPQDEIRDHYANPSLAEQEETVKNEMVNAEPISLKTDFPWKK
jgi:hypothetical protein